MGDKLRNWSWIRYFASVLLLIVIGAGAFYFLYVEKRKDQQSEYLLRTLDRAGQSVAETIGELRNNVDKAAKVKAKLPLSPKTLPIQTQEQLRTKLFFSKDGPRPLEDLGPRQDREQRNDSEAPNDPLKLQNTIKGKLALIPGLDRGSFNWYAGKSLADSLSSVSTSVSVQEDKGDYVLSFLVRGHVDASSAKSDSVPFAFSVNARLATLLRPSLPEEIFDGRVFVARSNGTVLLQTGGGSIQLMQLPKENSSEEVDGSKKTDSSETTEVRDVKIAGNKYKMFLQPFRLPLDIQWKVEAWKAGENPAPEHNWVVGGLIPSSSFLGKTMAVPPMLVTVVVFLIIVLFLCLPFLRIRFIGLREALKANDVAALALALTVACSLVTFAFIHIVTYRAERDLQDSQLEAVADSIGVALESELDALECELIRQTRMWQILSGASDGENGNANSTKGFKLRANILDVGEPLYPHYPHFEMVFGMDGGGKQTWKWSIKKTTTPLLPLPGREYFQRAKNYDLDLRSSGEARHCVGDSGFVNGRVVQSIRSKTTSQVFAILSLRLNGANPERTIVTAIEAELLSLIDPVLPPDYGFAVIDKTGEVQFHSDSDRNLREDFFEEIDYDEEITSSVFSGVTKCGDVTYTAEPLRVLVTPLEGTPWTLAVFVDRKILDHLDLETILFSLALYGLYLVVFLLSCVLINFLCTRKAAPGAAYNMWFWPDPKSAGTYRRMLVWVGAFIVLWLLGNATFAPYMPIWCIVTPPILAAVIRRQLGRRASNSPPERQNGLSRRWRWTYVALLIGLYFSIAFLPPLTFYSAVRVEQVSVITKLHQVELAQSLRERVTRHVDRYREVRLANANGDIVRKTLYLNDDGNIDIQKAPDIHVTGSSIGESVGEFSLPESGRSNQWLISIFSRLRVLPTYDWISAAMRGLSHRNTSGAYDVAWFAGKDRDQSYLSMKIRDFRPSISLGSNASKLDSIHFNHLNIRTSLEHLRPAEPIWIVVGAIAAILALFLILRSIMRVTFLSNMNYPLSVDGEDLIDSQEIKRQLRIRHRRARENASEGNLAHVIDYQDIEAAESIEPILTNAACSPKAEILLTKFDYGLGDDRSAAKKLQLLEGLVALKDKRIVIDSSVDPLYFLTSAAHDFWEAEHRDRIQLDRWAAVLQPFVKLRRKATEGELDKLQEQFKAELQEIDEFKSLKNDDVKYCLVSEGWPNQRLRDYAKALAKREELKTYTAEDVIDQIGDLAAAHYRRIWSSCSTNEKVLLHRLAQEGFVNWRMEGTLRSLIRRRIVVAAPSFRLMNESFRRFVLRAERPEVFLQWERDVQASLWSRVRLPLVLSGMVVAAFFIATQREAFNQSLGMLAALTASVPAIIRIIGILTESGDSSSTEE